jgi:hypothetical protein
MVKAVKAHAVDHYDEDGWDEIVEGFEDWEIVETIERNGAQTEAEAVDLLHRIAKLRKERGDEIRATAW